MSGRKKRLLRLVERDKFRKLDKFLTSHQKTINATLNEAGQNGLHVAARLGHADSMRILLKHGCDALAHDGKNCYPLHYAAKYCLKRFSKALVSDLVSSLLTHSSSILDGPNAKGTTCRTLVKALERKDRLEQAKQCDLSTSSSSEDQSSREEMNWHEKLNAEAEEDLVDHFGRAESAAIDDDYLFMGETYEAWADRIFAEYRRKHTRTRTEVRVEKKSESTKKAERSPLKLERKRNPACERYLLFCRDFLASNSTIHASDLPFSPITSASAIVSVILDNLPSKGDADASKRFIRDEIRRWHPDKFAQLYQSRFVKNEAEEILKTATHVVQSLIEFGKS